jgi:hypothetical protein
VQAVQLVVTLERQETPRYFQALHQAPAARAAVVILITLVQAAQAVVLQELMHIQVKQGPQGKVTPAVTQLPRAQAVVAEQVQ